MGLMGLAACVADGGYDRGYTGPAYGGALGYDEPIYRGYEPRRNYYEPEYGRRYPSGGYRQERQFEERRQPEREERRQPERAAPPPREERRPGPGIRAPFERSSAQMPRYSGPADPPRLLETEGHEGGR